MAESQATKEAGSTVEAPDLDQVIEQSHLAVSEFAKGNPEPLKEIYSHRDDVSLANPFGPATRGWKEVAETMERAALHYRDGEATGFEGVAKYVTPDLAYIVEVERFKAKVGGSEDITPLALRVTSILRPEEGVWKIVHRHADPITSARPAESVVQT
jgi:ketosteroid isomerase-like protein